MLGISDCRLPDGDFRDVLFVANLPAAVWASDRDDDKEIMDTPDRGIHNELLESAKCIAIIPGDVKFAFIFGGNYGRGVATCRTGPGWSAPMFVAVDGESVGYQIGGSSTDLVMLFMNDRALQSLLNDKFKLGADASVAAGPVRRHAAANTHLSYTRRSCRIRGAEALLRVSAWTEQ